MRPDEIVGLLKEIKDTIRPAQHVIISVITGVMIDDIINIIWEMLPVIRVMPNTAIEIGESMTCISTNAQGAKYLDTIRSIFDCMGKTKVISETEMIGATKLLLHS
ncbi:MAG: pyrroline-5-carboxylate reductase family protein [bacterium]